MELWQSLQEIPEFWGTMRWIFLGVNIVSIIVLLIGVYIFFDGDEDPVFGMVLISGVVTIVTWTATFITFQDHQYNYISEKVTAYAEEEGYTPIHEMKIYTESEEDREYDLVGKGDTGMRTAQGAKFTAVNSDGELVDVEIRWLPVHDTITTKKGTLPESFDPVTLKVTKADIFDTSEDTSETKD